MDIIQKTRDDYNTIAKHFSGTRYDTWPELQKFKSFVKDGQHILDWGCGNGRLLLMLKGKNVDYYGVDQSRGLLNIAKKKYVNLIEKGKAKFFCSAFKEKKFADNFFDMVFMIASFHHLPDKKSRLKLLKKVYKELKPEGKLIITVWNLESNWSKEKIKKKQWKKMGDNDYLIPWKNPKGAVEAERYYHHFEKEELEDLLVSTGFKIDELAYYKDSNWTDKKEGRNLVAVVTK